MDKYTLSSEGRARFKRMQTSVDAGVEMGIARTEGYLILDYLYQHGAATVADIEKFTGLSWGKVTAELSTFIHHGLVEGTG
jgi:DNA-binding MarR family transcriptional regulator